MMSAHHIEEIYSVQRERVSLHMRWNDARFIIHLDQSLMSTGTAAAIPLIENSFIERYHAACDTEDDDEADALQDEILDAVIAVGRPTFDQLAPPPTPGAPASTDLHTFLFPRQFTFCFRTIDGNAELIRGDNSHAAHESLSLDPFGHPFCLNVDKNCNLPRFSTKDIRVLENLLDSGYIARVAVGGQEMCSKAGDIKGPEVAQRELDCLWKITVSKDAAALRVPKLLGLIETPNNKGIVGFLEEYIPVSGVWELSTLGNIENISAIKEDRRKKWASQIQETVHLLHQVGVTWGDGKASNVLIHRDTDDAWIIDFGGGWSDGWVDQELSGTVKGDELAVRKILEFLEV